MNTHGSTTEGNVAHRATPARPDLLAAILGTAFALSAFLAVIRAKIIGFAWTPVAAECSRLLAAMYFDFLFVGGLTLVFVVAVFATGKRVRLGRILCRLYVGLAVLSLVFGMVNVKFLQIVRRPFNYQWLYYSDFLRSADAQHAIRNSVSGPALLLAALLVLAMIGVAWLFGRGVRQARRTCGTGRRFALFIVVPCAVYFPCAAWGIHNNRWNRAKLENPVVAFLGSVVARSTPPLFAMQTPVGPEEFLTTTERGLAGVPTHFGTNTVIRNVLLFVLESVPAEYVEGFGGAYPVTPTLNRYRKHAQVFHNIYAHSPSTDRSTVSILCSIYPWISFLSLTSEHPAMNIPSLSSELKAQGFRTGFFSSSDNHFQGMDKFLAHRGFDVVQDYRDRPCNRGTFVDPEWNHNFLNGVDDECTTDALIEWINRAPEKPFFGMLWTMMTHYPYFLSQAETDFGVKDPYFNRYLNALRHGDECLGKVLHALEEKGLADSTLVVVVGDHGEAFGRHDQLTHACKIYEENLRVPLMLINPQLFRGEESSALGGLIDIAPTVMEILHLPAGRDWQGRSLFSQERIARAYFYAPWSDFLFGYREGNRKCIFNATANEFEIYDLQNDPQETTNLADQSSDLIQKIPQRLAAWVQYQDRFIKRLVAAPPAQ